MQPSAQCGVPLAAMVLQGATTHKVKKFTTSRKDEVKALIRNPTGAVMYATGKRGKTPKHFHFSEEDCADWADHLEKEALVKPGNYTRRSYTFFDAHLTFFRPRKYDMPERSNISRQRSEGENHRQYIIACRASLHTRGRTSLTLEEKKNGKTSTQSLRGHDLGWTC